MLHDEAKDLVLANCLRDPLLFLKTFLFDHFNLPTPWVHRGVLAVLTQRTDFLLRYGDLRKLVSNFVQEFEDRPPRQIFHVVRSDGSELNEDELHEVDYKYPSLSDPRSWAEVEELRLRILLDLGDFTMLMMPRGSSKTTIAGLGVPLYNICYQQLRFMLYVSNAGPLAAGQIESVRRELTSNETILEFFGDLKPRRSDDERWSKEKIETVTGVALQYRGKGAAVRGINHNNFRPDVILIDDPQDKDDVRSDVMREEDKRWAMAELMPARERIRSDQGAIRALCTFLGNGSLSDMFAHDPRWTTVNMGVKDKDGDFIWLAYMDEPKYQAERESYQRAGLLADFHREYHNEDFLDETQVFPKHFIQYDPDTDDVQIAATYADPAVSEKRTADFFCICTLGITTKGIVYVLDMWLKRGAYEEAEDEYFRQSQTWGSVLHGYESNASQAAFGIQLRSAMFRRGHYFELEDVQHKTKKISRIVGALRPRYASGYMRHRIPFPEYEAQLQEFRRNDSHDHDDGPDAAAACLVLLDPTAAYNAGEDPAETHLPDIEDVVGEECMDWCA